MDVDDAIIEVEGYLKQGASFGYSGVRDLNAVLAIASTSERAPVVLTQRLRKGSTGSARGAKRIVAHAPELGETRHRDQFRSTDQVSLSHR